MGVRVGVGMGRFPFEKIRAFRHWLDACEDSPIDSIWQSDQVVGAQPYAEPLSLLATVAGATERLEIGMNAIVLGFRDPLTFARQCATIDFLSDGRFLPVVGVGAGGAPGWKATGRDPKGRGGHANECLEVIRRLWREDSVSFEGKHLRFEAAQISPRPKQDPLPLSIGGSSPAAVRRTVKYGSGWLAGLQTAEEAAETAAQIRQHGAEVGKPIPDDHYGATLLYRIETGPTKSEPEPEDRIAKLTARVLVRGDAQAIIERLAAYTAGGITKFVAIPASRSEADFVEQNRLLASEVIPAAMAL
jgi:alkanesulfonate monooxygenase SsuD/methylene tetrahydromethanopterin reductase-like flavin-dependent oxidoreductase (luciferase family)